MNPHELLALAADVQLHGAPFPERIVVDPVMMSRLTEQIATGHDRGVFGGVNIVVDRTIGDNRGYIVHANGRIEKFGAWPSLEDIVKAKERARIEAGFPWLPPQECDKRIYQVDVSDDAPESVRAVRASGLSDAIYAAIHCLRHDYLAHRHGGWSKGSITIVAHRPRAIVYTSIVPRLSWRAERMLRDIFVRWVPVNVYVEFETVCLEHEGDCNVVEEMARRCRASVPRSPE